MLEESSKQGCLISSYLLWENNRKAAVSSHFLSPNNFYTNFWISVICKEYPQKGIADPQSLPSS